LCCIRGKPEWSKDILGLCIHFKDQGVVGIDIAGDEAGETPIAGEESGEPILKEQTFVVFVILKYSIIFIRASYARQRRY
jgi:adenosine deaminase